VFVQVSAPVESGWVASMARPSGNMTGFTNFEPSMGGKWVELLKEIAPGVIRTVVLMDPETPVHVADRCARYDSKTALACSQDHLTYFGAVISVKVDNGAICVDSWRISRGVVLAPDRCGIGKARPSGASN
jgi:hypothetical protein